MPKASGPLIGGDPEFFIANYDLHPTEPGKIVPSCARIGGIKKLGLDISPAVPGCTWLEDNVAVELNFPPQNNGIGFAEQLARCMREVGTKLHSMQLKPVVQPVHTFLPKDLMHPRASIFGCDPDFCAYDTDTSIPREVDVGEFKNVRFCGGHIHLSYNSSPIVPTWAVVMLLDVFIGLPSVCRDAQGERRKAYGQAGLFRPKEYGVEYRTMSNWWLTTPKSAANIGRTALSLVTAVQKYPDIVSNIFARIPFSDVREAINNEDIQQAHNLWSYAANLKDTEEAGVICSFEALPRKLK